MNEITEYEIEVLSYQSMQVSAKIIDFFRRNPDELLTQKDFNNILLEAWELTKEKYGDIINDNC